MTAALIAPCGTVLIIRDSNDADPVSSRPITGIAMLIGTVLIYVVIFERLGYVPATFLQAAVVSRIFGASLIQAAISGGLLFVGSYLLFDHGQDAVLPTGLTGGLI